MDYGWIKVFREAMLQVHLGSTAIIITPGCGLGFVWIVPNCILGEGTNYSIKFLGRGWCGDCIKPTIHQQKYFHTSEFLVRV